MLRCGLLGETLGHSYSPMIHHELGEYDYRLFEVSKEDLDAFLCSDRWDGLNVTIPYKRDVMPLCDEIDPAAEAIGSVNTIVRCEEGGGALLRGAVRGGSKTAKRQYPRPSA